MKRREFLLRSLAAGASSLAASELEAVEKLVQGGRILAPGDLLPEEEIELVTAIDHNCGGRCVLVAHVRGGRVTRVTTDDGTLTGDPYGTDTVALPQLRACVRGRAYVKRLYHPDRLKYPLVRTGKRGEAQFKRVSWEEALDLTARRIREVVDRHGAPSILGLPYQTGSQANLSSSLVPSFLLDLLGGKTATWSKTSWEGARFAIRTTYGLEVLEDGQAYHDGNDSEDFLDSKLIILWGIDPAFTIFGTNTPYFLSLARERGAKFVVVDPAYTASAATWGDWWIPIRPATDTAALLAMAHVLITEDRVDRKFVDRFVHGFDAFKAQVLGETDGEPKTPEWQAPITGIPAEKLRWLARLYADSRPAALVHGWAPGRVGFGEQFHRAANALQALGGNIGVHGGYAGGGHVGFPVRMGSLLGEFQKLKARLQLKPTTQLIKGDKWADLVLEGRGIDPRRVGAAGPLSHGIRMVWLAGGNYLNQVQNVNKGVQALAKVDFVLVQDQFMTPQARWADVLLPVNTLFEREDIVTNWAKGHYAIYRHKVIDSLYESKSDFEICRLLAARLGVNWFDGRPEEDLLRGFVKESDIPDFDTFKRQGVWKKVVERPWVAYERNISGGRPFPTPTGKIEIESEELKTTDFERSIYGAPIPAVPTYIPPPEGVEDPLRERYPLQLVTCKMRYRCHSSYEMSPYLRDLYRNEAWIHPSDAAARGVRDGDRIRLFNDRGATLLVACVTRRIMPGVVKMFEGAWYDPDPTGLDRGGCANVLTRDDPSPAGAYPLNNTLVEVSLHARGDPRA